MNTTNEQKILTKAEAIEAMTAAITTLEALRRDGLDITTAKETADEAIKAVNKCLIVEQVEKLVAMEQSDGLSAMLTYYINHQFIEGFKLVQDKQTDIFTTGTTSIRVSFLALDAAMKKKITNNGAWMKYIRIWCDGVINGTADDDKSNFTKASLPADLLEMRKKNGWTKSTKTALTDYLNDLVSMILPAEICPKMLKCDVTYLQHALLTVKSTKKDVAGEFAVRTEGKMEEFIFRAIFTRMNKLAYAFQNERKEDEKGGNKPAQGGDTKTETGKPVPAEKSVA